jgi:FKBP-type peptidyl-prolyl cis-trans isomerase (trigger factor)
MSKGILAFNLPEEKDEFKIASNAMDWALTVWDLDQYLRDKIKHSDHSEEDKIIFKMVQDQLSQILDDSLLDLDMIG